MFSIRLDAMGPHRVLWPDNDTDILTLGEKFLEHEESLEPELRLPTPLLDRIRSLYNDASGAESGATKAEAGRAVSAESYRQAVEAVYPLLDDALQGLSYRYRKNLARLEEWGLETNAGSSGVTVYRPRTERDWIDFLAKYVEKEKGLPEAERLEEPSLADMEHYLGIITGSRKERDEGRTIRSVSVAERLEKAAPLLDTLQVAAGYILVLQHDVKVSPELGRWGFRVVAQEGSSASSSEAGSAGAAPPA